MKRFAVAFTTFVVACSSSPPGSLRTIAVLTPPNTMSSADSEAIAHQCVEAGDNARGEQQQAPVNYGAGAAAIVGSAIFAGLVQGSSNGRARRQAIETCLKEEGYIPVILSEDQWTEFRSLDDFARVSYLAPLIEAQSGNSQAGEKAE